MKSWIGSSMLNRFKNNKHLSFFLIFYLWHCTINAQTLSGLIELGNNPSSENFWWLKYNNFGFEGPFNFQKTKIIFNKPNFQYEINIFSNLFESNNISYNQSYFKFSVNDNTFLRLGRYYRDFSTYLNDELSSGSILISNNAQAMPKIGIVSEKYLKRNNKLRFQYGIAHGVFNRNEVYINSPFLHEKFLYLIINQKNNIWGFGLIHEAIWGGTIKSENKFAGKQPQSVSDFFKVFISADGPDDIPHANSLGNHLGIWDFSFQKSYKRGKIKAYYQHLFEDTSGLRFDNKTDGLWGLELENYENNITVLLEYINTKNQYADPPYVQEDYYKHGLYSYGWSYKNYTLGNPLISHLNPASTDYIYLAFSGLIQEKYYVQLRGFQELSKSSLFNYKFELMKILENDYMVGAVFLKDTKRGFGFKLVRKL